MRRPRRPYPALVMFFLLWTELLPGGFEVSPLQPGPGGRLFLFIPAACLTGLCLLMAKHFARSPARFRGAPGPYRCGHRGAPETWTSIGKVPRWRGLPHGTSGLFGTPEREANA